MKAGSKTEVLFERHVFYQMAKVRRETEWISMYLGCSNIMQLMTLEKEKELINDE